jgi:hypothetical protein
MVQLHPLLLFHFTFILEHAHTVSSIGVNNKKKGRGMLGLRVDDMDSWRVLPCLKATVALFLYNPGLT